MPMNQNFPEGELPGPEKTDPTSDVRFRYAAASPPNPWDQTPARQVAHGRSGASRSIALLILLIGVIILSVAVLYGKFIGFAGPAEDLTAGGAGETQVVQQPTPPALPSSSPPAPATESSVSTLPPPATPASSAPAVTEATTTPVPSAVAHTPATPTSTTVASVASVAPVAVFEAPDSAKQCAANVNWRIFQANGVTSCPFAENVAIAMKPNAGTTTAHQVEVTSPVTGENYQMDCRPVGQGSFTCEGGDGATVVLEHRHDLRPGPRD